MSAMIYGRSILPCLGERLLFRGSNLCLLQLLKLASNWHSLLAAMFFRMQQFYFLIFMGEVILKDYGTWHGGGGGGGRWGGTKQGKNLKKEGVKDYLSNTTSCLPTPYKMNSP